MTGVQMVRFLPIASSFQQRLIVAALFMLAGIGVLNGLVKVRG